jgi:hypothetical protein
VLRRWQQGAGSNARSNTRGQTNTPAPGSRQPAGVSDRVTPAAAPPGQAAPAHPPASRRRRRRRRRRPRCCCCHCHLHGVSVCVCVCVCMCVCGVVVLGGRSPWPGSGVHHKQHPVQQQRPRCVHRCVCVCVCVCVRVRERVSAAPARCLRPRPPGAPPGSSPSCCSSFLT